MKCNCDDDRGAAVVLLCCAADVVHGDAGTLMWFLVFGSYAYVVSTSLLAFVVQMHCLRMFIIPLYVWSMFTCFGLRL
eukprot:m.273631 g.273631  ORF g.273631 m.273631 type:complete len:78 (-) comp95258_c0_seq1:93-326(-)